MTSAADPRLLRLLGGDALAPLRKRLRQRYERAAVPGDLARLRIAKLGPEEHAALASLLGRPARWTGSLQIDLDAIDASLQRAGIAASLREALELLDGPIVHRATARGEALAAWSAVMARCDHAGLKTLLATPVGLGLLKRLARQDASEAAALCKCAEAVLQRLPAGGMPRAQLAAETLGDAHALDSGQAVAALVLAVLRRNSRRALGGPTATMAASKTTTALPDELSDDTVDELGTEPASDLSAADPAPVVAAGIAVDVAVAEERSRELWAAAGVLVNELARPALFLNLPITPCDEPPAPRPADLHQPAGEPGYASLRSLLRNPPRWDVAGRTVYVCENPNLLAIAADHWGAACAPMVCTDGMPAAAQRCLLAQLAASGAELRYHGDFDWAGLQIGNVVMREHGAQPWRFGARDYEVAVMAAPQPGYVLAVSAAAVTATWDESLAPAMALHRLAVAEESLAATLLPDLDNRAARPV